jgi:TonB-dependent receptor
MNNAKRGSTVPHIRRQTIALAVAGACAAMVLPARAQETPGAATPTDAAPTVVVTGVRAAMQSTLNLKRNSDGIVDGIVADDIGKFPDTNLAESLQRISGVSIDRNRGEGAQVTVRGVGPDLNLVLLNGRQMPTANLGDRGSRSFDFSNLASEAVSQIQVYKSARADTPPGGIGATVNIMTGRPLDLGNLNSIGIKTVYDRSNDNLPNQLAGRKLTPEVSTLFSRKFGEGDIFGVSLSASYQSRNSGYNQAAIAGGWNGPFLAGDASGATGTIPVDGRGVTNPPQPGQIYQVPQNVSYFVNGSQRQRTNGQLTLQFRPTRDWNSTLDYTYARNKVQTLGAELAVWFNHPPQQTSTWVTGPVASPTVYEEQVKLQDLAMNGHDYATVSTLKSTGFNTQFRVNSGLRLSLDAHHSVAQSGSDSPFGTNNDLATASFGRNTTGVDFTHEMPVMYTEVTPMGYEVAGSWFQDAAVKQTIDQVQAGGKLNIGSSSNLNFGLGATRARFNSAFQHVQQDAWQGTAPGGHANAANVYDQTLWQPTDLRQFFSKLGGSDDPRLYNTLMVIDFPAVRDNAIKVTGNPALFTPSLANPSEVRTLREKSNSLYGQFNTEWDTALPMHTGIGLRYERTTVESDAVVSVPVKVNWVAQNELPIVFAPGAKETQKGEYHNWLPTFDWDVDLRPNLKVRASYGVTIGRPRWDQIQGGASYGTVAYSTGTNVTRGNPGLTPVKSKNLDLSVEWYYTKQSMVSLGLYHKDLKGYAGQVTLTEASTTATTPLGGKYYNAAVAAGCAKTDTDCLRNYILANFDGQPGVTRTGTTGSGNLTGVISGIPGDPGLPYNVSTIVNQNKSSLKGAEVNWQHMFENGFGFQANYTYVKSDLTYNNAGMGPQFALIGLSNSANLVGIYEDKNLSVRLAYNWRGQFLSTVAENNRANPGYVEPYGQVDLSIGYNVNENLSLSLEAINLTDAHQRTHGRTDMQVLSVTTGGPRYMLGARYKF